MALSELGRHVHVRQIEKARDDGERRAQLVGDVGDEVSAHVVDAAAFGDVVRDDDGVALVGRDDGRIEQHGAARGLKRIMAREVARTQPRAEGGLRGDEPVGEDAADVFGRDSQMNARHGIDPFDDAVLALEDDDALGQELERLAVARVARLEPCLHVALLVHDELARVHGEKREERDAHAEEDRGRACRDAQPQDGRDERDQNEAPDNQNAEELRAASTSRQCFGHGVSFLNPVHGRVLDRAGRSGCVPAGGQSSGRQR